MINDPKDAIVDTKKLLKELKQAQQEQFLEKEIAKQMQKVHISAMRECAVAICSVILKKALDTSKSPNKRIKDIIKFCNVSLGNKSDSE